MPKGKRISRLETIIQLANSKKCVITHFNTRIPAAFVQNMQLRQVWDYLNRGLYYYIKEKSDANSSK